MNTLRTLFLLIVLTTRASAQTTLTGAVRDGAGKGIPFASVALLHARDSSLVKGTISKETGSYEFVAIRPGHYRLSSSAIGYGVAQSTVFEVGTLPLDAPPLTMIESVNTLKEVTVATKKPFVEQEIDRLVINVAGSIIASGSTALEVLEKAPGVTVDRQNDALQLRGKDGVIVQIDGKQTYLSMQDVVNLLKNMPSDNVEKIELITNPGARYDAAGNSGIINIRLKKNNSVGTNGAASITGGSGRHDRERASLQLNHRESKVNLFGNYSFSRGGDYWDFVATRDQSDPVPGSSSSADINRRNNALQKTSLLFNNLAQNAKVGLDYMPTKQTTIGLAWTAFWSDNGERGPATAVFRRGTSLPVYLQTETDKRQQTDASNQLGNINFQHTFSEKGSQLTADFDLGHYQRQFENTLVTTTALYTEGEVPPVALLVSQMPTTVDIRSAKADYSRSLPNKWKLEVGVKSAFVRTDNDLTIQTGTERTIRIDPAQSNHFQYTEQVSAAYVSMSGKLATKTDVQLGLRVEQTHSEGNSLTLRNVVERTYLNVFPSLFVMQPIAKEQALTLSYSYRIDRPNYQNLNPARSFIDPYAFSQGNPYLKPQYTHSIELKHSYKNKLFTSLGASYTTDLVFPILYPLDGNRAYRVYENIGQSQGYNLTVSFPINITKSWIMQTTLLGYYNLFDFTYESVPLLVRQLSGRLTGTSAIRLGKGWTAELSGRLSAPSVIALSTSPWLGSADTGLQKTVSSSLKVKLSIQDLLHTNRYIITQQAPSNAQSIRISFDSRVALLNLSYTFGNEKLKAARQRRTAAEEEMQRTN
ncbi:TonB-dependent receptor [Fibrella sp. ES10-3-2-2]|nr:TonB-dependent receptor [Fibrella sp. ES10-3-2-2]